ncbi:hypothetical protein [Joostella sp.]|uniref:hypothetical protein n=1 Tax=Joostella sp. TaxID=2231138 RepID=UPI003A8D24D7
MAVVDTTNQVTVDTSKDNVVIMKLLETVPGGRTLDVSRPGISALTVLQAGHVIIRETATGEFKALGLSSGSYETLPASHTYAGILTNSVLVSKPHAAIMTRGTVNESADLVPYAIPAAAKTALKVIQFTTE